MTISYRLGWTFFRISYALYFRARFFNPERVPRKGPAILASNHASFLDPPLVGIGLPRGINYMARDSLFRFPILGSILRSWEAVPVDRDGGGAAGLRQIMDRLARGGVVLLFPEGTRSRDGALQAPRTGIGLLVAKSSAPVIPVRVFGTLAAYSRHHPIPRPTPISVKYGRPLAFAELRAESLDCSKPRLKEIYAEIAQELMTAIGNLEPCEDRAEFP